MAINVTFNGATIFKPGAYSKTNIDLGGGFPIGPAGLVAVIGEADAGAPGAEEVDIARNRFSGDQLVTIRNKYVSGPIVDAAAFLFAPGSDAAIPGGASTVWFYKTNASLRSTHDLTSTYGTVRAREWGVGGNRLTYMATAEDEVTAAVAGTAFDETALAGGETLTVMLNGDSSTANTFTAIAVANNAAMAAAVADGANWSAGLPVGFSVVVGGADGASTLSITMDVDATAHQNGWGRSFELTETNPGDLALLGLSEVLAVASVEPSLEITLDQKRDDLQESEIVGGNVVMTVGRDDSGGCIDATIEVDADNIIISADTGAGLTAVITMLKDSFGTLSQVVNEINLQSGWTASTTSAIYNQLSPEVLDWVSGVGAYSTTSNEPARLKKDADDVATFFSLSSLASIQDQSETGLPDAETEVALTGGAKGATSNLDIVNALEKFTKFHVNSIVPLFSRDAGSALSGDIADGVTDGGSTYTIAGIHQLVKTHISLMKTTKKRSERQGYLSFRGSYADAQDAAGTMADGRIQMCIQDIRQADSQGTIKWFQPWAMSCLVAGARGGAPIGEPLTFKFLNASGIRHTAQPLSTAEEDIVIDFDPDLQTDDAIQSGITFMEAPQTGGFRVVVDNTTYGKDANFVWNRGNVIYAADIVAFNLRTTLENIYVGRKNTVSVADVQSTAASILTGFLQQGVTVSTEDAPQGFKNLTVELDGNVLKVNAVIKIVEGIDFILSEITIQRATASA